jgi:adenylate cyclase
MDAEELRCAGLYVPDAPDAGERLELLEFLRARGISVDDMVAADRAGRLVTLAADTLLGATAETFTAAELAALAGTSVERLMRIRVAAGLPVDPTHDRLRATVVDDIAAFEAGAVLFGDPATLSFTRVMGAALARMAEAAVALFMAELRPSVADTASPAAMAGVAADATAALMGLPPVMAHLLQDHVVLAIRRAITERALAVDDRAVTVGIGFLDLVGSTEWARGLSFEEHALALGSFESAAWDACIDHGGRVVKLIGDGVMFVAPSGAHVARIASDLVRALTADDTLPAARGAAGFGTVAARDGDYFGPLVNLVARAVKVAAPGGVVVTEAVADDLADTGFDFVELPEPALRGIDEPGRLFALH